MQIKFDPLFFASLEGIAAEKGMTSEELGRRAQLVAEEINNGPDMDAQTAIKTFVMKVFDLKPEEIKDAQPLTGQDKQQVMAEYDAFYKQDRDS